MFANLEELKAALSGKTFTSPVEYQAGDKSYLCFSPKSQSRDNSVLMGVVEIQEIIPGDPSLGFCNDQFKTIATV